MELSLSILSDSVGFVRVFFGSLVSFARFYTLYLVLFIHPRLFFDLSIVTMDPGSLGFPRQQHCRCACQKWRFSSSAVPQDLSPLTSHLRHSIFALWRTSASSSLISSQVPKISTDELSFPRLSVASSLVFVATVTAFFSTHIFVALAGPLALAALLVVLRTMMCPMLFYLAPPSLLPEQLS